MGDDGVADGAAQVGGRQTFEQIVGDAVGGVERELQRDRIGDAGAIEIGRRLPGLGREPLNLMRRAMYQSDADAQAAQEGQVKQQVAKILVLDHCSVQRNHK